MKFRTKLLYLAAGIALAMLGLLARLYAMQVVESDQYLLESEAVSRRVALAFPARASIADRNGEVLVDNELRWELQIDWLAFCPPERALMRSQLDPAAWPDPSQAQALSAAAASIAAQRYPSPVSARRFFATLALRSQASARSERDHAMHRLCTLADLDPAEVKQLADIVEAELAAYAEAAASDDASRSTVLKAWRRAKQAANDPEYWDRVLRFPRSLALEPVVAARLDWSRRAATILGTIADALAEHPEHVAELLAAALHHAHEQAQIEAPPGATVDPMDGEEIIASQAPDTERRAAWESERRAMWSHLALDLKTIQNERSSTQMSGLDATQLLQAVRETNAETIKAQTSRLANLRERVIAPWLDAYRSRWVHLLARDAEGKSRLQKNPLILGKSIAQPAADALELCADALEGLTLRPLSRRVLRDPRLLPHVMGAVGMPDGDQLDALLVDEQPWQSLEELIQHWYGGDRQAFASTLRGALARQPFGLSGVEQAFDNELRGKVGARVALVDARGTLRSSEGEWPSASSAPVRLTIDRKLQTFAIDAVKRWEPKLRESAVHRSASGAWTAVGGEKAFVLRGAMVLMDVQSGELLALVNFPSYDPELLAANTPEGEAYRAQILHGDDDLPGNRSWLRASPMLNRSVGAAYAPGSTFKVLSSIVMLESNTLTAHTRFEEGTGKRVIQGRGFQLTTYHGAGNVDLEGAIAHSSNGYFWHFSERLPGASPGERYARVLEPWARAFGFGQKPGIELRHAASGKLPTPRAVNASELAQLCIGQGRMLASPLQVARLMATVANRGKLVTPHLELGAEAPVVQIQAAPTTWTSVIQGMKEVVTAGTAKKSTICRRLGVAAKTGTAQIGSFTDARGQRHEIPTHAWFAGFAPADKPKIAFAVLAEYSGLYGGDLADLTGEVLAFALSREQTPLR